MRLTKVHYTVLDAVYRQGRAILYRVLTKETIEKVFPNANLRRETFNRLITSFDSAKIQRAFVLHKPNIVNKFEESRHYELMFVISW